MTTLRLSGSRFSRTARRLGAPVFMAVCISATANAADMRNPFDSAYPYSPASYMSTYTAPAVNPVFADTINSSWLHYRISGYGSGSGPNQLAMLGFAGFSFSYLWLDSLYDESVKKRVSAGTSLVSINKGFFFNNSFGFGAGYSFSESDHEKYDGYRSLSLGVLWRPFSFISLGFTTQDINEPRLNHVTVKRKETYSISIRPLNDLITLSFDSVRYSGERFHRDDMFLAAEARMPYDISLFAKTDVHGNVAFGAAVPFGFQTSRISTGVVDYYGDRGRSGRGGWSSLGLTLTGEKYESPIVVSRAFLKITLRGDVKEIEEERLFAETRPTFYDIMGAVRAAGQDDHIAGIILQIDDSGLGLAQTQELRQELKMFRQTGKKVYALLSDSGNKEYYLAAAADKIYFVPNSTFEITGLMAEVYFIKNTMDKAGVKFESIRRGKYKSFNEPFTREHMSEEYRENLTALISGLNEQYLADIAADRKISRAAIDGLFAKGFMNPEEARAAGFIDAVEYPDIAERELAGPGGGRAARVNLENYLDEAGRYGGWGSVPGIAVIYVPGSIIKGESGAPGIFTSDAIGDETYRKILQQAFEDPSIRALVIRINSGGGSAAASDFMWHYLIALKKKYNKPVVFSFGNVAASGGYYIACTGDRIFASPGTITGSIGVVSGKITLRKLYEMLGINKDVIKMSEFADIFSESKELSEAERKVLQRAVDFTYDIFTGRVQEGRGIPKEKIPDIAEGRVFSGSDAKAVKLTDSLGGLMAALEYAGELGGITGPYRVLGFPSRKAPLMELLGSMSMDDYMKAKLKPLAGALDWMRFEGETGLYLFPYRVEIK